MANEQYAGRARQAAEAAIQQMNTEQPMINGESYVANFTLAFREQWDKLPAASDVASVSESASVNVNVQASDSATDREKP